MNGVLQAGHFYPVSFIAQYNERVSVREVFADLSQRERGGGFLFLEGDRPVFYVKSRPLANNLLTRANGDVSVLRSLLEEPLGRVIQRLQMGEELFHVAATPVAPDADLLPLQSRPEHVVFPVADQAGQIGWFINHEGLSDTVTDRPVFLCINGHENIDPDHGSCSYCPGTITQTH